MRVLLTSATILLGASVAADAAVLPFSVFENASGGSVVWQGQATILADSDFTIKFETTNPTTGSQPFIGQIYFRNTLNSIISSLSILNDSGPNVDFTGKANGNLPGGNNIDFTNGNYTFSVFDADSPAPTNGVGPGEFLTLTGTLHTGASFAGLVNVLSLGGIGVHVQGGCTDVAGSSCSAIVTPLPAGIWFLLSSLGGLLGFRHWSRRDARLLAVT